MSERASTSDLERRLAEAETALRAREERLRENEAWHRLLIANWAQAVWETDADGLVVADSPSWRAYTGQTLEEWLGYGWLDAIHPDERAYAERQWRAAVAVRGLVDAEFRLRAPDGGWRWTNVRAAPVIDAGGAVERWIGVNVDIDAAKRADTALRESEKRYRSLFDNMAEGLALCGVVRDDDGQVVDQLYLDLNSAVERQLGVGREAFIGRRLSEIAPNADFDAWMPVHRGVAETGEPWMGERYSETTGRWYEMSVYRSGEDQLSVFSRDISERKRAEFVLSESRERQSFLLRLSDALRAEPDGDAVAYRALQMLLDHLGLDRCYITDYRPDDDEAHFPYQLGNDTVSPLPAKVRLSDFPDAYAQVLDRTFVIEDDFERRGLSEAERANSRDLGMRAMVASTVRRGGRRPLSSMAAVSSRPRRWSSGEIALVEDAAERTWAAIERTLGERALRESEEKYRTLFDTIDSGYGLVDVVHDDRGHVVDVVGVDFNRAYEPTCGIKPFVGRRASELMSLDAGLLGIYEQVVRTGSAVRFEIPVPDRDRWVSAHFSRVGEPGSVRVAVVFDDITERKRAEALLRESEERQSFLLALGDAMRSEVAASDKIRVAARLLGERLNASRVLYAEYDWDRGVAEIFNGWFADGAQAFPAVMRLHDYDGQVLSDLRAGRTVRVDNVGLLVDEPGFAAIAEVGVQALLSPPLIIDGQLAMNVSVHQHEPRHWTDAEVALVREAAERLWAEVVRARAEAALRESEERFRQFAQASAAGLWIRDAELAMEFVSPAIARIYGTEPEALLGEVERWAAMVVPEDREAALAHLEAARDGRSVVHEFRVQRPSDGHFRWIRDTDFPLRSNGHIARIGGIAEDVTEAKLAVEHQRVLLAELQHRVRNIMGMIRSMTNRTAPGASGTEDYRALLEGRLLALSRVQALLTQEANAGGSLRAIIESEVAAQADHVGQFTLTGPDIRLAPKSVEVLTLAFHELATNALKYGALSVPEGRLSVTWAPVEKRGAPWLSLDWTEDGAPPREPSKRRGFGSELIEARIPYELGGRGRISIGPGGARCHLEFPLRERESILETDAPQPVTIFGGTLDMTGGPDLTGRSILVVEDDYYMANDTAAALRGAGADVLGPCPSVEATQDLLADHAPTHAVLDLNLGGGGPQFEIAYMLKARGVPFVFLTGYDPGVIPKDLEDVVRMQKPVPYRSIVEAMGQL